MYNTLRRKKVLCLMLEEGHQWYIDLAQQYELNRAKEYKGFSYATIKGKIREGKGRRKNSLFLKRLILNSYWITGSTDGA